jgi:hypothetical protein
MMIIIIINFCINLINILSRSITVNEYDANITLLYTNKMEKVLSSQAANPLIR